MFHLTNSSFVDLEVIDPEGNSSPSRTIETNSSKRGSTAKNNGSLQLAEEYSARELTRKISPTSNQLQDFKNYVPMATPFLL